jgi:hypothetical protein
MTQPQWEAMTEEEQTAHCVALTQQWISAEIQPLTGNGGTVVSGAHIHQQEVTL